MIPITRATSDRPKESAACTKKAVVVGRRIVGVLMRVAWRHGDAAA